MSSTALKNGTAARKPGKPATVKTLNKIVMTLNPVQVSAKTGKAYTKNARYDEAGSQFIGTLFLPKSFVAYTDGTLPQSITLTVSG